MPDWACPNCGAVNLEGQRVCGECGRERQTALATTGQTRSVCPYDGSRLTILGACEKTGGFPLGVPCPFSCPICRGALEWDGRCEHCHGCTSGERRDWTFPGDRYELYDDKGQAIGDGRHWIKIDGPRAACTPEENAAGLAEVKRILAKSVIAEKRTRQRPAR